MKIAIAALLLAPLSTPQQSLALDCLDVCTPYNTTTHWGSGWQITTWSVKAGEGREECTQTCKQCSLQYSYNYTGSEPWYKESQQGNSNGTGSTGGSGGLRADCSATNYWFGESGTRSSLEGGAGVQLNCSCL